MGARFAGPISILRNWTFCLFYVMAELWGSVVVSLLFWGFANQVCASVKQLPLYREKQLATSIEAEECRSCMGCAALDALHGFTTCPVYCIKVHSRPRTS